MSVCDTHIPPPASAEGRLRGPFVRPRLYHALADSDMDQLTGAGSFDGSFSPSVEGRAVAGGGGGAKKTVSI